MKEKWVAYVRHCSPYINKATPLQSKLDHKKQKKTYNQPNMMKTQPIATAIHIIFLLFFLIIALVYVWDEFVLDDEDKIFTDDSFKYLMATQTAISGLWLILIIGITTYYRNRDSYKTNYHDSIKWLDSIAPVYNEDENDNEIDNSV